MDDWTRRVGLGTRLTMKPLSLMARRVRDKIPRDLVELEDWRRRLAMLASALLIGVLATLFARAADFAQYSFARLVAREPYVPLAPRLSRLQRSRSLAGSSSRPVE
jgi:hypothetical protein